MDTIDNPATIRMSLAASEFVGGKLRELAAAKVSHRV